MVQIFKTDEKLKVYDGKKVILFGAGSAGRNLYRELKYFNVDIWGFCDNNADKWKTKIEGKEVISPDELKRMYQEGNVVIQITSEYQSDIAKQLKDMSINDYIYYGDAVIRLMSLRARQRMKNAPYILSEGLNTWSMSIRNDFLRYMNTVVKDEGCILCLPPKTGDYSLVQSLEQAGLKCCNFWHRPFLLDEKVLDDLGIGKIKIVTAVRDPISQNISELYQMLEENIFWFDLEEYWDDGGDAEKLFERMLQAEEYMPCDNQQDKFLLKSVWELQSLRISIQNFWSQFTSDIGDVMNQPFDKEEGYSILTVGRYEIFVYQIEKLNKVASKLFEWLGIPDAMLVNNNVGEQKWYAESYRQAQKELMFSKDYFDKCFDEPYVKHFYSEEDIEKMKSRWRSHIRKDIEAEI